MDLQKQLDMLKYPPTMQYKLDGLIPISTLQKRVRIIDETFPEFFELNSTCRFLDIGCNKGFFSLLGDRQFGETVAIDNRKEYIDFCKQVPVKNATFIHTGFQNYITHEQFDRIFIGNAHHYLYSETYGTWDWVSKLAAYCSSGGLVLIEGPTGVECLDVQRGIQERFLEDYTWEKFLAAMEKHFDLVKKVPATTDEPDRYVMLFRRKKSWIDISYDVADLLRIQDIKSAGGLKFHTFFGGMRLVAKTYRWKETKLTVAISAMYPSCTPIVVGLHDADGKWVGWLEKKITTPIFSDTQGDMKRARSFCCYQIFLANLGYTDIDAAAFNYGMDHKELVLFDKNQVCPINEIGTRAGLVFYYMKMNFKFLFAMEEVQLIKQALEAKNPAQVGDAYRKVLEKLETLRNH